MTPARTLSLQGPLSAVQAGLHSPLLAHRQPSSVRVPYGSPQEAICSRVLSALVSKPSLVFTDGSGLCIKRGGSTPHLRLLQGNVIRGAPRPPMNLSRFRATVTHPVVEAQERQLMVARLGRGYDGVPPSSGRFKVKSLHQHGSDPV